MAIYAEICYRLTHYVNDINTQNTQVLMEYGANDQLQNTYTYGNQRISRQSEQNGNQTDYYLYDGRGSVSQVVNGNTIVQSYEYDPFGNTTSGAPDFDSYYGYNAEETNPVTGMQYLRARYYDTQDGRFNEKDTYLGDPSDPLTLNRYTYTANNPVMKIDPSGHAFGWVKKALNKAADTVKKVTTKVVETAKKVGSAVGNGIKSVYNNLVNSAAERADNKKGQNGNYNYSNASQVTLDEGKSSERTITLPTSSKSQYRSNVRSNSKAVIKEQMEITRKKIVKAFCDGLQKRVEAQDNIELKHGKELELTPSIKTRTITDETRALQREGIYQTIWGTIDLMQAGYVHTFIGLPGKMLYEGIFSNLHIDEEWTAETSKFTLVDSSEYKDDPLHIRVVKDFMNNEIIPMIDLIVPEEGTASVGITGIGSYLASFSGSLGLIIDSLGNINGIGTKTELGAGTANFAAGVYASVTDADTNEDLDGIGYELGGSVGPVGYAYTYAQNDNGDIHGTTTSFAWSPLDTPLEGHLLKTNTEISDISINIVDITQKIYDNVMKW